MINATFVNDSFYKSDFFEGIEDNGTIFKLLWKPLSDFQEEKLRLVPENLLGLIQENYIKEKLQKS